MEYTYLSCAETGKLVRRALKINFPGVKFSVSQTAGGSINVRWTDGPRLKEVESLVSQYAGAEFDGMQDLKTYRNSIHPITGEPVNYGADYIFCQRNFSDRYIREKVAQFCKSHGIEVSDVRDGYPVDAWSWDIAIKQEYHRAQLLF